MRFYFITEGIAMMFQGIFVEIFSKIDDPRVDRTKKHPLIEVIGLAICAVIAGAQAWTEIEDFCLLHQDWLKNYFTLPSGIPSHDTFSRVFSALDPGLFQEHFLSWLSEIKTLLPEGVIAIDGKTLRGSHQRKKELKGLHIVNAWSCENQMTLGQLKVDSKTNEITVIPNLLERLALHGAIITIDAMGCQRNIAEHIVEKGGDYILAVKGNQGDLHEAMQQTFSQAENCHYESMTVYTAADTPNNDHGRLEERCCVVLPLMYLFRMKLKWKKLKSLICITSKRTLNNIQSIEQRFYISSLDPKEPDKILKSIRDHWQVENNLHWCLDVIFREDECRIRDENAALNMSWMRKMALAFLKNTQSMKGSIRRKQLQVWARPYHLIELLKN